MPPAQKSTRLDLKAGISWWLNLLRCQVQAHLNWPFSRKGFSELLANGTQAWAPLSGLLSSMSAPCLMTCFLSLSPTKQQTHNGEKSGSLVISVYLVHYLGVLCKYM